MKLLRTGISPAGLHAGFLPRLWGQVWFCRWRGDPAAGHLRVYEGGVSPLSSENRPKASPSPQSQLQTQRDSVWFRLVPRWDLFSTSVFRLQLNVSGLLLHVFHNVYLFFLNVRSQRSLPESSAGVWGLSGRWELHQGQLVPLNPNFNDVCFFHLFIAVLQG